MRIKQRFDPNKIWFTSDTHFYHKGIIDHVPRPFTTVESMNDLLILWWNAIVPEDAIVFVLGDFAFTGSIEKIKDLVSQLNGTIYLVYGNHCLQNGFDRPVIQEIFGNRCYDVLEIEVADKENDFLPKKNIEDNFCKVFMSHYRHLEWNRGAIHVHGHHHSFKDRQLPFDPNTYDVGLDNNNWTPISWYELKKIIQYQNINLKRK